MVLPNGRPAARNDAREIAIIVAVAANGVIGKDNALPWRVPADLKRFRQLTAGHTIVMGRRTWQSLARALPDRQNIVVTRNPAFAAAGAEVAHSLDAALASYVTARDRLEREFSVAISPILGREVLRAIHHREEGQ